MEDFNRTFIRNLQFYMAVNNLNQKELAVALGVSQAIVSAWISGKKTPRPDKLAAIAKLLGITLDELLTNGNPVPTFEQEMFYNESVLFKKYGKLSEADQQIDRDLIERLGRRTDE